jgi:hypothetical protein
MIILSIMALGIYLLIILFSLWLALVQAGILGRSKKIDLGPIAAFCAGWVAFAFSIILVQKGSLDIPIIPEDLWTILIMGAIGTLVGVGYLGIARIVIGNTIMTGLFVLGSVGGSLISFFFYIVYEHVQVAFITSAVGFLFGVLLYVVLFESRGSAGGIQDAYGDFVRKARRGR